MKARAASRLAVVLVLVAFGTSAGAPRAGAAAPARAGAAVETPGGAAPPPPLASPDTWRLSGTVGLYAKYNTNLDLADPPESAASRQGAFVADVPACFACLRAASCSLSFTYARSGVSIV